MWNLSCGALVAVGIAVELFVSLASLQDASCLGRNLVITQVGITQVRERICVNICLHAHELASDRMERIGGKVHEQQRLLLVVGHLVADVVAGPSESGIHRRELCSPCVRAVVRHCAPFSVLLACTSLVLAPFKPDEISFLLTAVC